MKKQILAILLLLCCFSAAAQYTVKGGKNTPIELSNVVPHHQVFILNGLENAEISYSYDSEPHQWRRYEKGITAGYADMIGYMTTVTDVRDGYGYFVGDYNDPATDYVWIIDYSRYQSMLDDIEIEDNLDKCEYLRFSVDAENINALEYYTNNAIQVLIPKIFKLKYNDLSWKEEDKIFVSQIKEIEIKDLTLPISAPLTNTVLTLSGDQFAEQFGIAQTLTTKEYTAVALRIYSDTVVVKKHGETEQETGGRQMSAPVEITFNAYANEPAAGMYIWTIYKKDGNNENQQTLMRYVGKSVTYTFEESGDYTANLEVIGVGAACSNDNESYDIFIGESDLQLPNAFSPGSSIGSNDIYRVSYKSLVSFKASIYNRWGNLLYHWEDPSQGWDGRVNGNFVPAGVYYIIVEAKGADGRKYYRSSDINILRKK